jgi:hypothetical protein
MNISKSSYLMRKLATFLKDETLLALLKFWTMTGQESLASLTPYTELSLTILV